MSVPADSLLRDLPPGRLPEELFTTLACFGGPRSGGVRIERIVSTGQVTPEGAWYDQDWDEFVLLVQGAARLLIEGEGERPLAPGDWLMIPAGTRHRVTWTDPGNPTVWLAVHIGEPGL